MAAISFDLNKKLINRDYKFIPLTIGGCYFFKDFNQTYIKNKDLVSRCNLNAITKRYELIEKSPNSIIIIGGSLPSHLLGGVKYKEFLDGNKIRIFEYKSKVSNNIKKSFVENILDLSKYNNVILVYPYPEISFSPPKKITDKYFLENKSVKKILEEQYLYEPYKNYLEHSKKAFELLNSIKSDNVYRVFPHTLFCNTIMKDNCVTHDDRNIFYSDENHLSLKGAEMINDLIMKEIERIELKSN